MPVPWFPKPLLPATRPLVQVKYVHSKPDPKIAPFGEAAVNLYDVIDYPSGCHAQTHPSRLAASALLRGFEPVPTAGARIVELGCGDGWNLIPIAEQFPHCQCFGIDLAQKPIERGKAAIEKLGLENIRLQCGDLTKLGGQSGSVDYLIAHGLYSWVPDEVRESILSLCGRMLSDQGLAFISFNALPGSHSRLMIREMLHRHVGNGGTMDERIASARGLLSFLHAAAEGAPGLRSIMRPEYARLLQGAPAQLVHDEMSDCHTAFYFSDFIARSSVHGLEFVANAELVDSSLAGLPAEVQELLAGMNEDDIRREQYVDYARLRPFRQVLLSRRGVFERGPDDGVAADRLHVAGSFNELEAPVDLCDGIEVEFRSASGKSVVTETPAAKAALALLCSSGLHPRPVIGLCRDAVELLAGVGISAEPRTIRDFLVHSAQRGLVTFWHEPPLAARDPGDRPTASRLARFEAAFGGLSTTAYHQRVDVSDPVLRRMILLMDGTRGFDMVVARLREEFAGGMDINGPEFSQQAFRSLKLLASAGLLADPAKF